MRPENGAFLQPGLGATWTTSGFNQLCLRIKNQKVNSRAIPTIVAGADLRHGRGLPAIADAASHVSSQYV
jgi:hypothetical protein